MRQLTAHLFLVILVWISSSSFADISGRIEDLSFIDFLEKESVIQPFDSFVYPNEPFPLSARPIYVKANPGVHISVGSERSFMGAALNPMSTHLLIYDANLEVVRFSVINRALLAAAANRAEYLRLRLNPDFDMWKKLASQTADPTTRQVLSSKFWFDKWTSFFSGDTLRHLRWTSFHREPKKNNDMDFYGANYLFDDALYSKISRMAKIGRIRIAYGDISSADFAQKVAVFRESGIQVSVLDISNAWQPSYLDKAGTRSIVSNLLETGIQKGILIITNQNRWVRKGPRLRDMNHAPLDWSYYGFEFTEVLKKGWEARLPVMMEEEVPRRAFLSGNALECLSSFQALSH
ncbi:MAG: hypothetical protein IT289_13265 [Oligoflexia bacterium]|nr:hypothetical protein [Oligoflexia bacterium]